MDVRVFPRTADRNGSRVVRRFFIPGMINLWLIIELSAEYTSTSEAMCRWVGTNGSAQSHKTRKGGKGGKGGKGKKKKKKKKKATWR